MKESIVRMNAHDVTLLNEKLHRCRKVLGVVLLVSVAVGVVMALLYDIMIGGASVLLLGGISAAIGIFPVGFDPQYGFDSAVPYLVV